MLYQPVRLQRFLWFLVSSCLLGLMGSTAQSASQRVVFEGATSEHKWDLKELNPDLPADWTGYDYLVLELKASSPQRFSLALFSGERAQRRQMQPLPNVWIRAAVPLQYFRAPNRAGHDLASVGKVPRNSFWIGTGGAYGPLDAVTALGVSMQQPLGKPALEIRSVRLAKDDPGSDVLDQKPVVDEFGQWMPADWPGKVKNLDQLKQEWTTEQASLHPGDFGWCPYGGYLNTKAKATGFFRVEQVDGRWWFVDPDGHLFFSTSSTGMGMGGGEARLQGREDYFAALPPQDASSGRRSPPSFYAWNLARRHGADSPAKWVDFTSKRLDFWGLNTIGNWSEGCEMSAILIAPEYWWLEAGSSSDLQISGNVIEACRGIPICIEATAGNGEIAPGGAHRNLTITGNTIKDCSLPGILVSSTTGLRIEENKLELNRERRALPGLMRKAGLEVLKPVVEIHCVR